MIPRLPPPAICVIDDEEADYRPLLDALLKLGLGCVHIHGKGGDALPPVPFKALRLVFADLHLSGQVGKAAAAHTANIFRHVVSADSGPVLVVVWSKYASDPAGDSALPPEDQPTERELFVEALFGAEPKFKERLFFVEMAKPRGADRPDPSAWIGVLQVEIENALKKADAFDVLWTWESQARAMGVEVSEILTQLAIASAPAPVDGQLLSDTLKILLRYLAQQQGGPDCSEKTAPQHLLTVFSLLGQDTLEAEDSFNCLNSHGQWLAESLDDATKKKYRRVKLNSYLLTTSLPSSLFTPGTVYEITDNEGLVAAAGFSIDMLHRECFSRDPDSSPKFGDFKSRCKPILLEISPACDFHQGHRRTSLLLAGVACPEDLRSFANAKEAFKITPTFEDRFTDPSSELALVICSRYRLTAKADVLPAYIRPWFRLRDMLMSDIRNWHSGQVARVGFLSF